MQIILAYAKIMNVSIKREQSKLVCSVERIVMDAAISLSFLFLGAC